ncbi:EcoKI restriction-modification system protein HsdS [Methanobrevibacter filiformis]|uniref:EcoKI restriction-modification system protein HsdS n=1 Tax=Methanobrevibacter filiformis TaxID=55758 RepID=A0A166EZX3_9EURY|nr:EcoKI restriction-modification system protein HsdS [Methanobrevibacter filiformis]
MNSKVNSVKIGEYLYIKGRIGWKGLKKDEYLDKGEYRIINATALESDGINWNNCGFISKERYDESPEIMLRLGDILISKDGTIGKIGYVKELDMPTTVASGIFVVRNLKDNVIDTDYIYNYFQSSFFKSFIKSSTEGSVIPHLYQRDFYDMEINLFDLDTLAVQ